jgi:hypothetical protein
MEGTTPVAISVIDCSHKYLELTRVDLAISFPALRSSTKVIFLCSTLKKKKEKMVSLINRTKLIHLVASLKFPLSFKKKKRN